MFQCEILHFFEKLVLFVLVEICVLLLSSLRGYYLENFELLSFLDSKWANI